MMIMDSDMKAIGWANLITNLFFLPTANLDCARVHANNETLLTNEGWN